MKVIGIGIASLPFLAALSLAGVAGAQQAGTPQGRTWVRSFGLERPDALYAAAPRSDGGVFLTGQTTSFGSGGIDAWVMRLDPLGETVFEIALDGASYAATQAVLATPDGGCLVVGSTTSFGAGGFDGWVAKLDGAGGIQWQKAYGSSESEILTVLAPSPDGYYLGGMITALSVFDLWLLEIDHDGNPLWQQRFTLPGSDFVAGITPADTGLVVAVNTASSFPGSPGTLGILRPWLLSLDGDGRSLWQKVYDAGGGTNVWNSIQKLDDGLVVAGEVRRAPNHHPDVWVVRLDADGDVLWDSRFGDPSGPGGADRGIAVRATATGEFLVLARRESAEDRLWLLELDAAGTRLRDETYQVRPREVATCLELFSNGDLLLGASSVSLLDSDALVLRISPEERRRPSCVLAGLTAPKEWSGLATVVPVGPAPVALAASVVDTEAASVTALTGTKLCPPGDG